MGLISINVMVALFSFYTIFITGAQSQTLGVCYGRVGNNLPPAQEVVRLYQANGIRKMRIYSPTQETLQALRGSNIELILDAPNVEELGSNPSFAMQWVRDNIMAYTPDVKFRYIAVGNEINPGTQASRDLLRAMQYVHNALVSFKMEGQIKVSTATYSALIGVSYPPSHGSFREDAMFMAPIVRFLSDINSPLLVNIYPYFAYKGDQNIQLPYALFNAPGVEFTDEGRGYDNLFDAMLDSTYAALQKVGGGNLEIIVSESGWPSNGGPGASIDNAGTYYRNLVNHASSGKGTPRRPGKSIEVYLFAMFDENQKTGEESEKFFGLFTPDKRPKYQLL